MPHAVLTMPSLCETVVLLTFCVTGGLAIHCYECNSRFDRSCGDKFTRENIAIVDCDVKLADRIMEGNRTLEGNSTLCRKIVHDVQGHHRVVRSCGWIKDKEDPESRECKRKAGTYEVMLHYCACYEDNCNAAGDHQMSLLLLLTAAASWLICLRA